VVLAVFFGIWSACEFGLHTERDTAFQFAGLGDVIALIPLGWWISKAPHGGHGSFTAEAEPRVEPFARYAGRMDPVETACEGRLYYHRDGWARAVRLVGAGSEVISVQRLKLDYRHVPFEVPDELRPRRDREVARRVQEAREAGKLYFDGPNTRLLNWRISPSDGDRVGLEESVLELTLGPIGWYDFDALNGIFEEAVEHPPIEFYEYYVGLTHLVTDGRVERSKLSNILDNAVALVTSDGYVGYRQRSGRQNAPGVLTSAVAENTNRYLDDAEPSDFSTRHNMKSDGTQDVRDAPSNYKPVGVPHPVAAVLRGIEEEISKTVRAKVDVSGIYVTGIAFSLDALHPSLLFAVFVDLSRDEILAACRDDPGTDYHKEGPLFFIRANREDPATRSVMKADWIASGQAATIRALDVLHLSDGDTGSVIRRLTHGSGAG